MSSFELDIGRGVNTEALTNQARQVVRILSEAARNIRDTYLPTVEEIRLGNGERRERTRISPHDDENVPLRDVPPIVMVDRPVVCCPLDEFNSLVESREPKAEEGLDDSNLYQEPDYYPSWVPEQRAPTQPPRPPPPPAPNPYPYPYPPFPTLPSMFPWPMPDNLELPGFPFPPFPPPWFPPLDSVDVTPVCGDDKDKQEKHRKKKKKREKEEKKKKKERKKKKRMTPCSEDDEDEECLSRCCEHPNIKKQKWWLQPKWCQPGKSQGHSQLEDPFRNVCKADGQGEIVCKSPCCPSERVCCCSKGQAYTTVRSLPYGPHTSCCCCKSGVIPPDADGPQFTITANVLPTCQSGAPTVSCTPQPAPTAQCPPMYDMHVVNQSDAITKCVQDNAGSFQTLNTSVYRCLQISVSGKNKTRKNKKFNFNLNLAGLINSCVQPDPTVMVPVENQCDQNPTPCCDIDIFKDSTLAFGSSPCIYSSPMECEDVDDLIIHNSFQRCPQNSAPKKKKTKEKKNKTEDKQKQLFITKTVDKATEPCALLDNMCEDDSEHGRGSYECACSPSDNICCRDNRYDTFIEKDSHEEDGVHRFVMSEDEEDEDNDDHGDDNDESNEEERECNCDVDFADDSDKKGSTDTSSSSSCNCQSDVEDNRFKSNGCENNSEKNFNARHPTAWIGVKQRQQNGGTDTVALAPTVSSVEAATARPERQEIRTSVSERHKGRTAAPDSASEDTSSRIPRSFQQMLIGVKAYKNPEKQSVEKTNKQKEGKTTSFLNMLTGKKEIEHQEKKSQEDKKKWPSTFQSLLAAKKNTEDSSRENSELTHTSLTSYLKNWIPSMSSLENVQEHTTHQPETHSHVQKNRSVFKMSKTGKVTGSRAISKLSKKVSGRFQNMLDGKTKVAVLSTSTPGTPQEDVSDVKSKIAHGEQRRRFQTDSTKKTLQNANFFTRALPVYRKMKALDKDVEQKTVTPTSKTFLMSSGEEDGNNQDIDNPLQIVEGKQNDEKKSEQRKHDRKRGEQGLCKSSFQSWLDVHSKERLAMSNLNGTSDTEVEAKGKDEKTRDSDDHENHSLQDRMSPYRNPSTENNAIFWKRENRSKRGEPWVSRVKNNSVYPQSTFKKFLSSTRAKDSQEREDVLNSGSCNSDSLCVESVESKPPSTGDERLNLPCRSAFLGKGRKGSPWCGRKHGRVQKAGRFRSCESIKEESEESTTAGVDEIFEELENGPCTSNKVSGLQREKSDARSSSCTSQEGENRRHKTICEGQRQRVEQHEKSPCENNRQTVSRTLICGKRKSCWEESSTPRSERKSNCPNVQSIKRGTGTQSTSWRTCEPIGKQCKEKESEKGSTAHFKTEKDTSFSQKGSCLASRKNVYIDQPGCNTVFQVQPLVSESEKSDKIAEKHIVQSLKERDQSLLTGLIPEQNGKHEKHDAAEYRNPRMGRKQCCPTEQETRCRTCPRQTEESIYKKCTSCSFKGTRGSSCHVRKRVFCHRKGPGIADHVNTEKCSEPQWAVRHGIGGKENIRRDKSGLQRKDLGKKRNEKWCSDSGKMKQVTKKHEYLLTEVKPLHEGSCQGDEITQSSVTCTCRSSMAESGLSAKLKVNKEIVCHKCGRRKKCEPTKGGDFSTSNTTSIPQRKRCRKMKEVDNDSLGVEEKCGTAKYYKEDCSAKDTVQINIKAPDSPKAATKTKKVRLQTKSETSTSCCHSGTCTDTSTQTSTSLDNSIASLDKSFVKKRLRHFQAQAKKASHHIEQCSSFEQFVDRLQRKKETQQCERCCCKKKRKKSPCGVVTSPKSKDCKTCTQNSAGRCRVVGPPPREVCPADYYTKEELKPLLKCMYAALDPDPTQPYLHDVQELSLRSRLQNQKSRLLNLESELDHDIAESLCQNFRRGTCFKSASSGNTRGLGRYTRDWKFECNQMSGKNEPFKKIVTRQLFPGRMAVGSEATPCRYQSLLRCFGKISTSRCDRVRHSPSRHTYSRLGALCHTSSTFRKPTCDSPMLTKSYLSSNCRNVRSAYSSPASKPMLKRTGSFCSRAPPVLSPRYFEFRRSNTSLCQDNTIRKKCHLVSNLHRSKSQVCAAARNGEYMSRAETKSRKKHQTKANLELEPGEVVPGAWQVEDKIAATLSPVVEQSTEKSSSGPRGTEVEEL